ncbi:MAG: ABC transporter ATP-binding protein [Lachnospiraceae bacterium]|nr:ABC transporter ATP-binding protein [Lachnospiraceae bacterium]
MLEVIDLHTNYGSIEALKGINLEVYEDEIVTLIGSNGAGKSTTLSSITGIVPSASGQILFEGTDITKMKASDITKLGIGVSPEGREVFGGLSVQENLKIGAYTRKDKREIAESFEMVYELFPRLAERKKQSAGTLSGGEQQMLAIGRALMSKPKLLLLDEPSMGLAPNLVDLIFELIVRINKAGTTILLIEQNANMALQIADRGYVLETGKVTLSDDAKVLQANDDVRKAYLGSAE